MSLLLDLDYLEYLPDQSPIVLVVTIDTVTPQQACDNRKQGSTMQLSHAQRLNRNR